MISSWQESAGGIAFCIMRHVTLLILLTLGLCSCSPYSKHLKQLESDYAAGRLSAVQYHGIKSQLLQAQGAWQSRVAASAMAGAQTFNNSMMHQQAINAYNQRTQVMSQPQSVFHYGTVNHNVQGTINHNVNVRPMGSTYYLPGY